MQINAYLGASLLAMAMPVHAIEIVRFEKLLARDEGLAEAYLTGVGEGFGWANSRLSSRGDKQLYCVPENLALNGKNYVRIALDEVERQRALGMNIPNNQIELALLVGLERTFSCPQK